MAKKRIEWIDLAKGFCITLVVFTHIASVLEVEYPLSIQARSFRMPLYFILSGLFFKQYEGFVGFLKRKTNKLLIPFVFFLCATCFLPFFINHLDISMPLSRFWYKRDILFNQPIWFLLCLFEINIIFYLLQSCAMKVSSKYGTVILLLAYLALGALGLWLGVHHIVILLYVDTALTCLPFFAFGWWLFRRTDFLSSPFNWKRDVPLIVLGTVIVLLFARPVLWIVNEIPRESVYFAHLCGISGTIVVLLISKFLGKIPLVSYWGRYSIIILCTHYPVMTVLNTIVGKYLSGVPLLLVVFSVTMIICTFLIMFMKKYMPHVTAQKDVIPVP